MTTTTPTADSLLDALRVELDALRAEVDRLRAVCAEAYQFAGEVGAPARVLDNLWAAAQGEPLPHESFLPVLADECRHDEPA